MNVVQKTGTVRLRVWSRFIPLLIYLALFSNSRYFLERTSGIITLALATTLVLTAILILKEAGELIASALGLTLRLHHLTSLAIVAGSVMLSLVFIEAVLQISRGLGNRQAKTAALNALAVPAAWEKRPVEVDGSKNAYYWHGVLHVHNRDGMRMLGDFPAKRSDLFRIIALGDSLTYGYGIAEQDAYPKVLERLLNDTFRIEVLNLGVAGAQSGNIRNTLRRKLPALQPDLVLYGVCLNDFLPSGVGEYNNNRAYQVTLPYKDHLIRKTLTGKLLDQRYDALLMRWGLRVDFLTDILKDFDGYQTRFAMDVKAMNAFVQAHGLPPMVAMVLDQSPSTREKRYTIVQAAERHLREAGIRVIPSDYIQRNDGRKDWKVSPWEGHPNEKANRAFAEQLAQVLRELPELQPYKRSPGDGAGSGQAGTRAGRGPGNAEGREHRVREGDGPSTPPTRASQEGRAG